MLEEIKAAFEKLKAEIEAMLGDDHAMHGRAEGVKAAVAHVDTTLAAVPPATPNPEADASQPIGTPTTPIP